MKLLQVIKVVFYCLVFTGCASIVHVNGRYTNVFSGIGGEEFRFSREPDRYEFYSRAEGGIRRYSAGTWSQNKKVIFLNGFDDKSINHLDVESKIEDYPNENGDKVIVQFNDDRLDTFTKVDIVVNKTSRIRVSGDSTFFSSLPIGIIQVQSYLVYNNLLPATPSRIDTLYSSEIEVRSAGKSKQIHLKFHVAYEDFYRDRIIDTLTVKDRRTLIWSNKEFRKMRE